MSGKTGTQDLRTELQNIAEEIVNGEDYVEIDTELYDEIREEGNKLLGARRDNVPVVNEAYRLDRDVWASLHVEERLEEDRVVVDGVGAIDYDGVDMDTATFVREHERIAGETPDGGVVEAINEWYREACVVVADNQIYESGVPITYDGETVYLHTEEPLAGFGQVDLENPNQYADATRYAMPQDCSHLLRHNSLGFAAEVEFDESVLLD